MSDSEAKWYVIHTYSGYENKVASDLLSTAENRNLQDMIIDAKVPTEIVTETVGDVTKEVENKIYPCYVFVKMIYTDETWYVVRNIRGCTGFVGPGSKPVPLSEDEMLSMGIGEKKNIVVDYDIGDEVVAISGAWRDTVGTISQINHQRQTVTIMVDMFGRETPVELGFTEVKKK